MPSRGARSPPCGIGSATAAPMPGVSVTRYARGQAVAPCWGDAQVDLNTSVRYNGPTAFVAARHSQLHNGRPVPFANPLSQLGALHASPRRVWSLRSFGTFVALLGSIESRRTGGAAHAHESTGRFH